MQIVENPAVARGAPLSAYFLDRDTTSTRPDYNTRIYRPLRNLAFRAVARAGGLEPRAFGIANLSLYVLSVLLVLALARAIGASPRAAAVVAALWAAAPVHVEAVAYASALGDQLSCALELAALWCALVALAPARRAEGRAGGSSRALGEAGGPARGLALGAASVALAGLAMLAKEMAVTTVGLVALAVLLGRRGETRDGEAGARGRARRGWLLVAAHLGLALAYLALRTHVVGRLGQEDVTARSIVRGLGEAPLLLAGYLRLALAPLGHRAAYVVPPATALELGLVLAGLAALAALALAVDRRARAQGRSLGAAFGLGWFALSLAPVLHLVPLWADLADRFALVPSVGLALAASALAPLELAPRRRVLGGIALALGLLLYVPGTLLEQRAWRSDLALWSHAAADEPGSPLAQANLGVALLGAGDFAGALDHLDRARALGRDGADLWLRRAMALDALARPDEARAALDGALTRDPTLARAHALSGDLYRRAHDLPAAHRELARAEALAPAHPSTLRLAAALAADEGRLAEAVARWDALARSGDARAAYFAAKALLAAGELPAAASHAQQCLALEPGQPQCSCLLARAEGRATDCPP